VRPAIPPTSQTATPSSIATATDTATVSSVAQLETALEQAGPGTVITLAPGTYQRDGGDRWLAAADGTADPPPRVWSAQKWVRVAGRRPFRPAGALATRSHPPDPQVEESR
jgi:hypothetical protein